MTFWQHINAYIYFIVYNLYILIAIFHNRQSLTQFKVTQPITVKIDL